MKSVNRSIRKAPETHETHMFKHRCNSIQRAKVLVEAELLGDFELNTRATGNRFANIDTYK